MEKRPAFDIVARTALPYSVWTYYLTLYHLFLGYCIQAICCMESPHLNLGESNMAGLLAGEIRVLKFLKITKGWTPIFSIENTLCLHEGDANHLPFLVTKKLVNKLKTGSYTSYKITAAAVVILEEKYLCKSP